MGNVASSLGPEAAEPGFAQVASVDASFNVVRIYRLRMTGQAGATANPLAAEGWP